MDNDCWLLAECHADEVVAECAEVDGGPLTYKNAAKLPEIVQKMPADRLLVETDCPYLSPLPYRGKRNEPAYVRITAECAANIRGESLADFAEQTTKNACEIYELNL